MVTAKKKAKLGSDGTALEGGGVLAVLALSDQVSFRLRPEGQEGKSQAETSMMGLPDRGTHARL